MRTRSLVTPAVASAALLGSGLLMVVASAERWWPACTPGAFDSEACLTRQDHLYDFVFVGEPWAAAGSAAELAGASMLLTAVAMVVLPSMLSRRPRQLTWMIGAVLAASYLLTGLPTLLSGISGEVVEWSGPVFSFFTINVVIWPAWAFVWWCIAVGGADWRPRNLWQLGMAFTLILSTPFPVYFLTSAVLGYTSYDTTPWTEAVGGVLLIITAALAWPAALRPERLRTPSGELQLPSDGDTPVSPAPVVPSAWDS